MILDYYRIFYYVAQYKSFSKAADVMGNNQPNITRCMNILENELGCKLFIRSNRGVQLTIEGERLFEHVSIAIEQLVSGENELQRYRSVFQRILQIMKNFHRGFPGRDSHCFFPLQDIHSLHWSKFIRHGYNTIVCRYIISHSPTREKNE